MTLQQLQEAQKEIDTKYNNLATQKAEIEIEQLRLQGEYRGYQKQVDELTKDNKTPENKAGKH